MFYVSWIYIVSVVLSFVFVVKEVLEESRNEDGVSFSFSDALCMFLACICPLINFIVLYHICFYNKEIHIGVSEKGKMEITMIKTM